MSEGDFAENVKQGDFNTKLDSWMNNYHSAVQQLDFGK
jgi:hypothetical protein